MSGICPSENIDCFYLLAILSNCYGHFVDICWTQNGHYGHFTQTQKYGYSSNKFGITAIKKQCKSPFQTVEVFFDELFLDSNNAWILDCHTPLTLRSQ